MTTEFIKLEPRHMRRCSAMRTISIRSINELNLVKDQKGDPSPILCLSNGNEIVLTEEGYNFVIKNLNPIIDNKIIGDGLGENYI